MKEHKEASRYMSAEERRAATVEALVELAAERNPGEITTTEIAGRMGLTQGALFRHFPTKEAILEAMMQWVSRQFSSRLEKVVGEDMGRSEEVLERIFLEHVGFVSEHPGVPRMIFGELQRGKSSVTKVLVENLLKRYREMLNGVLVRGKEAGELRSDLDIEAAATLFVGMIQGLVMQSLVAGDMDRVRREAPGVFLIFKKGIRV